MERVGDHREDQNDSAYKIRSELAQAPNDFEHPGTKHDVHPKAASIFELDLGLMFLRDSDRDP